MLKCKVCEWEGVAEIILAREMMFGTKEEFEYFVCPVCGCLQIKEVPSDLGRYYKNDYYSFDIRDGSERNHSKILETRILDVGCGTGARLCNMAAEGYVNLDGCDPFIEKDIHYENGVNIYKRTIHDMNGEYEYIYLNDSFEHMADPHEVMKSIYRLLSIDGIASIRLPVFPNIAYEMFGVDWYQLDAPRHLFLHSIKSMHYLAEKNRLKIVKFEFDSNNGQIIKSFLYSKGIPLVEQSEMIIAQYFTINDIEEINQNCILANQNYVGDHAIFFLMRLDR